MEQLGIKKTLRIFIIFSLLLLFGCNNQEETKRLSSLEKEIYNLKMRLNSAESLLYDAYYQNLDEIKLLKQQIKVLSVYDIYGKTPADVMKEAFKARQNREWERYCDLKNIPENESKEEFIKDLKKFKLIKYKVISFELSEPDLAFVEANYTEKFPDGHIDTFNNVRLRMVKINGVWKEDWLAGQ